MKEQKTMVIYSRCSSEDQKKGFSHKYQIDGIKSNPMVKGMSRLGIFSDSVTGTKFDNREQLDLIYSIYEKMPGTLDYIFVYKWDRLGRNVGEAFQAVEKFRNIGIEINCPEQHVNFEDPNHTLLLAVAFAIAQVESAKISERTKDGIYAANSSGYFTASAPIGYTRMDTAEIRQNGNRVRLLVPDPEKAKYVLEAFEMYAEGIYSKADVFKVIAPKLGRGKSTLYRIFQNIVYSGRVYVKAYKGRPAKVVDGLHEAIVPIELFDRVQKMSEEDSKSRSMTKRSTKPNRYPTLYFLKPLFLCDVTGAQMTAYSKKKESGKIYHYYQSSRSSKFQIINAIDAHQIINETLNSFSLSEETYALLRKSLMNKLKKLQAMQQKESNSLRHIVERNEGRLKKISDDFADGLINSNDFTEFKERYMLEIQKSKHRIELISDNSNKDIDFYLSVLDMIKNMGDVYRHASINYKKKILRAIFPKGFSITEKIDGIRYVRTSYINKYFVYLTGNQDSYDLIINENGQQYAARLVGGERWDNDSTNDPDYRLLSLLIAG